MLIYLPNTPFFRDRIVCCDILKIVITVHLLLTPSGICAPIFPFPCHITIYEFRIIFEAGKLNRMSIDRRTAQNLELVSSVAK